MKLLSHFSLPLILTATLAGCNSSKPGDEQLKLALNNGLADEKPLCVELPSGASFERVQLFADSHPGSQTFKDVDAKALAPYKALESAGLIHAKGTQQEPSKSGVKNFALFELTAEGKKYQPKPGAGKLCYGAGEVTQVIEISDVKESSAGPKVNVTFKYRMVVKADWAKLPQIKEAFGIPELVLQNNERGPLTLPVFKVESGWSNKPA